MTNDVKNFVERQNDTDHIFGGNHIFFVKNKFLILQNIIFCQDGPVFLLTLQVTDQFEVTENVSDVLIPLKHISSPLGHETVW